MGLPSAAPRPELIQPGFEELADEIQDLKRRVSALEARAGLELAQPVTIPSTVLPALAIEAPAGAVVLLGKALLGIAGAYLLRALTDAAILPRGLGLAVGLFYAGLWLYLAARNAPERNFAAALDACTSAAILGPLLWEATLRFHAISAWAAAGALTAFAICGLALSWRKHSTLVARIAVSTSAAVAMTLLIGSRDLLPFTLALLALAAIVEFSASRDFRITERWLVAGLADLAVILLAYIVTRKGGAPEDYVPVRWQAAYVLQFVLVAIYSTGPVVAAVTRRVALTFLEIAQLAAALLSGFSGALLIGTANPAAGMIALAAGAGCYVVAFVLNSRTGQRDRNYFIYTTLAFALSTAGAWLALSGPALMAACSIFAVLCAWKGLHLDAAAYVVVVSMLSGVAIESFRELFGTSAADYGSSYGIVIAAALLCYARIAREATGLESRIAALVLASALAWVLAGAGARISVWLAPAFAQTSRTAVLMAMALVLGGAGIRWKRTELIWLVYAVMALGAYKLLTQDFPQEQRIPLVVSLLLYGSTLIVLPRVLRSSESETASGESGARGSNRWR
jgi:hypothetical protein